MCSEEDPQECHRRLLLGRVLAEKGVAVRHLRGDGRVQTEEDLCLEETAGQLALGFDSGVEEKPWRSVTIGFTQKSAAHFFGLLNDAGIRRLLDIRLNNVSQLAGFTRRDDLQYFLSVFCGAEYRHQPLLAPTKGYCSPRIARTMIGRPMRTAFAALIAARRIETLFTPDFFTVPTVLLCSEPTPEHCHRRLVAEYLQQHFRVSVYL